MIEWPDNIIERLACAAPAGVSFSTKIDRKGVKTAWVTLAEAGDLDAVADVLEGMGARFSTSTVFQPAPIEVEDEGGGDEAPSSEPPTHFGGLPFDGKTIEVDHHFDLVGDTLTVIVHLLPGGTVTSLSSRWLAATWSERELMELYDLRVEGHPDERGLFLDPSIEPAVLQRLIPHSTLVNAASSKGLWEAITARKEQSA